MRNNKKGQIADFFSILIGLFTIGVTLVGSYIFFQTVNQAYIDAGITAVPIVNETMSVFTPYVEYSFDLFPLFVYFALAATLILSAFFIPAHSGFFFFNIIGMIPLAFFAAALSNTYGRLVQNPTIAGYLVNQDGSAALARTTFIMQYLPWLIIVVVLIVTIVMYSKGRQNQ